MEHKYLITRLFETDITIDLPSAMNTILTTVLTFIIVMYLTRSIKLRPDSKKQNFVELVAYFVKNNSINSLSWSKYGKSLWSLGLTLISLLVVANTIGVLVEIKYNGVLYINSITADPTFTFTLAAVMILFTHYYGIKNKGFKHYIGTYTSNGAIITPFRILEEFTNLLTLALRLFGNIFAGEVLIGLIGALVTVGIGGAIFGVLGLVIWESFSLFIGVVQAYIFTTMVFLYLSHKVNDEH